MMDYFKFKNDFIYFLGWIYSLKYFCSSQDSLKINNRSFDKNL